MVDLATPHPGKGQALVEVHATALNPVDYKVVEGGVAAWHYPHVLGLDLAGKIIAVGEGVTDWQVGDRVSGHGYLAKDGCFAEQVVVPTYELAKILDSVSYEEAASILCSGLTAFTAVERKPNLQSAYTMLVHAGAGGVGSIAIQLAKLHGLQVFTTVLTRKVPYVRKLGPDAIIDYRKEDVSQRIAELTNGQGVDVIIDTVGKLVVKIK